MLKLIKNHLVYVIVIFLLLIICGYFLFIKLTATERSFIYIDNDYFASNYEFPYNFHEISKYKLPVELKEISGLAWFNDSLLVCVQDEKGIIYLYNIEKQSIAGSYKFEKKGDYEGVEVIDNTPWILRSDGLIFQVYDFMEENFQIATYETGLNSENDAEGLAYNPVSNQLLIACKGSPVPEQKETPDNKVKAIFNFDFRADNKVSKEPAFIIDANMFKTHKNEQLLFSPAGVAVHPITFDIYIITSVGKMLFVYSQTGELLAAVSLDIKAFKQPEGICFAKNGDLFISNEGRGGRGNILKILYKK